MKTEGVRKLWERYKFAALILAVGAALLLWPAGSVPTHSSGAPEAAYGTPEERERLQTDMESILGKIQGVGTVQVLLTLHSDGERQLLQDTQLQYSGSTAAPASYSRTAQTVVLDGTQGDETVVTRRFYPAYRGAVVVCQGGDRAEVRLLVTEAVSVLTGLSSDCIAVAKCP